MNKAARDDASIEELDFGGSARGANFDDFLEDDESPRNGGHAGNGKRRSPGKIAFIIVLVIALLAGSGVGGYWLWENRFRPITVSVNGTTTRTHINVSIDDLMNDNDSFGTKPGNLLSVSNKVLDANGGGKQAVVVNGAAVKAADWQNTRLQQDAVVTVTNGKDTVEKHTVKRETIAHKGPSLDSVNLMGGGAIQYVESPGRDGYSEKWTGEISKETVDKGVVKKPEDFKVTTKTPQPKDGKKYIALTFDDGPSEYTAQYQQILKEKGVKATFFNLSEEAANYGEQEKSLAEDGHEIASHSVSHKYLPKLSRDELRNEIGKSFGVIEKNSGQNCRMFRSPYGAFTAQQWLDSYDIISSNVLWTIDTEDWKRPGADKIKSAVLSQAGNGSIVLMHDGGGDRSQDVEALPGIIDGLKAEGFTFVTVSEMIKLDGTFPEWVANNQPAS
ncbi:polysaccharide deacetylase family protein [Bifidobacterium sp. SMB2]|uniref:Polysaccharide deacetylase family protein n=1 Tax=Bifidobacterium saimiriisciurei TaxID=2661627 RepID=A0ABX0CGS5_9BIFI|nr:polysaccharide deacetylase family protein [Bifidobacterium saimiriisciurei]NEG95472.1 polysaccharide deacetylase family protein [Bifidobacterium sp. SMB2]NEH11630.1 polysaccharide deacetylase family protein [Bifidobacterium saimiriisciurei]